jgi:Zn-dependent M28 family amino/carboxypeptidase
MAVGKLGSGCRAAWLLAACALVACTPSAAPASATSAASAGTAAAKAAANPAADRIRTDVATLASDAMQGRLTGTPGFERAADVVAARFQALGLQPAGDDGSYSQHVPLLQATRLAQGARLDVVRRDRTITLRFRDHFLTEPSFDRADASVRAPAVFVAQGVSAPDLKHDDFAGLDVRGKIAVVLGGAPSTFDDARRAFHASRGEKLRALAQHGAIGAVFVDTAEDEARAPWAAQAAAWEQPQLRLRAADGHGIETDPQLQVVARVSAAAADLLLDGSGHTAAELAQAAQAGTLKGFALPETLSLAARSFIAPLDSRNVVARLPGSDPALASLAIVLETARELQRAKPKRPLLFVALTAEEQGLLGAQWFAAHPPQPLAADINLDMPMLLVPTRDVVPIGAAHSTLQASLEAAAKTLPLGVSADPFPEEAVFVRSDQFAFVRAGVPALYLDGGVVPGAASAGKKADEHTLPKLAQREFLRRCYHQPCDDIRQPIQYDDAARMAALNAALARELGDAPQPPHWKPGDFFGQRFGPSSPPPSSR